MSTEVPVDDRPRWKSLAASLLLFAVWAVAISYPLCLRLDTDLPRDRLTAPTVAVFNLWSYVWTHDRLRAGLSNYWNAPIFFPETGTFAWSDPQPLTSLVFASLNAIIGQPVLCYNLILLGVLALNGFSAQWLLMKLGIRTLPAILGGLLAAAMPYVGNELGALQLAVIFPVFFALAALFSFQAAPSWWSALSLGWWTAATYLTSAYYGLFWSLFCLLAAGLLCRRELLRGATLSKLAAGVMLAGLLAGPFALAQSKYTTGQEWPDYYAQVYAARPADYLKLDRLAWGADMPWLEKAGDSECRLYPGTALIGFAVIGLVTRRKPQRRILLFAAAAILLAGLASLGLNLRVGPWQPYRLLQEVYPGFDRLRSPYRLGLFVQVFLVPLAGFGLQACCGWRRHLGKVIALLLTAAGLLEVLCPPITFPMPEVNAQAGWVKWLAEQPPGGVVMIPFDRPRAVDQLGTTVHMFQALVHRHPLVNGYSGFSPEWYIRLRRPMSEFPTGFCLDYLDDLGVKYVVVDRTWLTLDRQLALGAWPDRLQQVHDDGEMLGYRLLKSESPP